jgi:hypothetical protein
MKSWRHGRSFRLHTHRPGTPSTFHFHVLSCPSCPAVPAPEFVYHTPCRFHTHPIAFTTPTLSTVPTTPAPSPLASPHSTKLAASVAHHRDRVIHLLPSHHLAATVTRV